MEEGMTAAGRHESRAARVYGPVTFSSKFAMPQYSKPRSPMVVREWTSPERHG